MVDKKQDRTIFMMTLAMILGVVVGYLCYMFQWTGLVELFEPIGALFLKILKLLILPIVMSSIYLAVVNLGKPESLGKLGVKAISYYFVTTALAVFIGIVLVNVLSPGVGANIVEGEMSTELASKIQGKADEGLLSTIVGVVTDAFPSNIIAAMYNLKMLQIIVFCIIFGIISLFNLKAAEPIITLAKSVEKLTFSLVDMVMKYVAPIGVFALILKVVATMGYEVLINLAYYSFTVVLGLGIHGCILILIGKTFSGKSIGQIIRGLGTPILTAFSTASSAATLPVTVESVIDNLEVEEETANFVLPLGATINMDGTALYESVAVIFIAQVSGIDLSITQQVIVFITASLAAVGAAAIPGAGLITMGIVLTAVGMPIDKIPLILAVDRVLDMFRTAINVLGDGIGSLVIDSLNKRKSLVKR